jgi:hypothetical protein
MKKQLLNLSLVAMFVAISGIIMAAPHTAPVRALAIPAQSNVMLIDGVADAGYSAVQTMNAFTLTGCASYPDNDFTTSFQACWNMDRLYILATIADEYACEIPWTTSANSWTYDNIEVFLDMDTTGTVTAYDSNTIQLRFNRGITDSAQTPGRADQSEYVGNVFYENTTDGWVLEIGVPWSATLGSLQNPEDIALFTGAVVNGFDVSGADNDTDVENNRDCQTAWDDDNDPSDADEDLAWNNKTMFGVMTLDGEVAVDNNAADAIRLYPNPANTAISLELEGTTDVMIYNIAGELVMETVTSRDIDVSGLASGLYMVRTNKGMAKFMKQ